MPIISFPQGPNTTPREEAPELQEGEVESSFWECGCGSTQFHLWDDGEAVCSHCGDALVNVIVVDITERLADVCT